MSKVTFNIVNGEKYGDANDPKTRWTNHGVVLVDTEKGNPEDVEAFSRLIDSRAISVRVESIPTSKHWDGWLNIFKRTEREENQNGAPTSGNSSVATTGKSEDIDDKPIDLSEIPF